MLKGLRQVRIGACLALLACGGPFEVWHLGPIQRVRAAEEVSRANTVTLRVGGVARLYFMAYDATDSTNTPLVTWTSRSVLVANNLGSTVTAMAVGETYIVGEVPDDGRVFRDSVRVIVVTK